MTRTALSIDIKFVPSHRHPGFYVGLHVSFLHDGGLYTPIDCDDWRDLKAGDTIVCLSGPNEGAVETVELIELSGSRPNCRRTAIVSARHWEQTGLDVSCQATVPL